MNRTEGIAVPRQRCAHCRRSRAGEHGTWIWGAWGTILAVPMLVIVKSIADPVDSLKPVSRLMSP
jgi:hypothetical protein